jgi:hypothetical protein
VAVLLGDFLDIILFSFGSFSSCAILAFSSAFKRFPMMTTCGILPSSDILPRAGAAPVARVAAVVSATAIPALRQKHTRAAACKLRSVFMVVPFGSVHVSIVNNAEAACERIATACAFRRMSVEKADLDCMPKGLRRPADIAACRGSSIVLSGISEERIRQSVTLILGEALDTDLMALQPQQGCRWERTPAIYIRMTHGTIGFSILIAVMSF